MEYRRSEIRAGIFILTAFTVLVVMVFSVSDIPSMFKPKKDVKAVFEMSEGIEKNAPVRYSGMKIGKVKKIRVAPELGDRIELTLSVYRDVVIKEDSSAAIKTLGLVGGKYVEISTGTPKSRPLPPGGVIKGEGALRIEDLTRAGLEVVEKLRNIADNLNKVLGNAEIARSITATVKNMEQITANLKTITANKDEISHSLENIPELVKKLDESATNLKMITEKADRLLGENKKNIDATLENIREMTKNLKETTEEVKKHPWKLIRKP